ncbi:hypothetical protein H6G20_05385 [Desertifilum sp. FACHB-1129]|uniref:hypothetical protein n=1 Tax=unclassified Desertifilum TaxID=2621682 RepID=UPI0016899EAD|nr:MULTISPECIES: hypothetical protein [unclassified Desertifilum]MBD2311116.1 hypothetical protein [Desertifilum sp. FACHB-1129]MBD2323983.1 hypothetical protein [Desertifilum sp. FACHB-866]MBD2333918.1 hypothetical protein [Desertifilum sp. FACHB-868]MDA0211229.1 hypothetical protein [Cyanobacteria bacterium FC1]
MNKLTPFALTLGTSALMLGIGVEPVNGQPYTQDPLMTGANAQVTEFNPNAQNSLVVPRTRDLTSAINNSVNELNAGIGGILGNVNQFIRSLPNLAESLIGDLLGSLGITDNQAATQTILEQEGLFSVRQDASNKVQRDTIIGIANDSALSSEAQQQLRDRAISANEQVELALFLAQGAQQTDVSQQILQDSAAVQGAIAALSGEQLREAQQARVDRAMGNLINAQQARELQQMNVSQRRQGIATGNAAIESTGLISLPGGFYLGSQGEF